MNFDIRIGLYRDYGLFELEKRLYSLKRTSKGSVLKVEPSHIGPRPPESDTVSARNESIQSREIWNRDQSPTLPGGPISDRPLEAEDAHEMDSGVEGSVTSREPCSMPRNLQSVSSIRCAKDATSSRSLKRDTRYSLLELANPRSPSAKSVQYEV